MLSTLKCVSGWVSDPAGELVTFPMPLSVRAFAPLALAHPLALKLNPRP